MPIFSRLAEDKVSRKATPHAAKKRETALKEWNKISATQGFMRPNASAGSRAVSSKYNTPKKDPAVSAQGSNGKDLQAKQAVGSGNRENLGQTPALRTKEISNRASSAKASLPEPAARGSTIRTPSGLQNGVGCTRRSSVLPIEERTLKQTTKASKVQTVFKRSFERRKSPDVSKQRVSTASGLVGGDNATVSILGTASYWESQIKLSELEGKHEVSMGFFSLAVSCSAQLHTELLDVLKSYIARHPQNTDSYRETMLLYEGLTRSTSTSSNVVATDFLSANEIRETSARKIDNSGPGTACHGSSVIGMPCGLNGKHANKNPDCSNVWTDQSSTLTDDGPSSEIFLAPRVKLNSVQANYSINESSVTQGSKHVLDSDLGTKVPPAIQVEKDSTDMENAQVQSSRSEVSCAQKSMEGGNFSENPSIILSTIAVDSRTNGGVLRDVHPGMCKPLKLSSCVDIKASGGKKSKESSTLTTHKSTPSKGKSLNVVQTAVAQPGKLSGGCICGEAALPVGISLDNEKSIAAVAPFPGSAAREPGGHNIMQQYGQGFVTIRDNPDAGLSDYENLDDSAFASLPEPIRQDIRESTIWPELSSRRGGLDADMGCASTLQNSESIEEHTAMLSKVNELKRVMRYVYGCRVDLTTGDSPVVSHLSSSSRKETKPRRGVHFNDVPIILRTPSPRVSTRSAAKTTPNVITTLSRKGRGRRSKGTPYKEVLEVAAPDLLEGNSEQVATQNLLDLQISPASVSAKEPGVEATSEVSELPSRKEEMDVGKVRKATLETHNSSQTTEMAYGMESTCSLPPAISCSLDMRYCEDLASVHTAGCGGQFDGKRTVKPGEKQSSKVKAPSLVDSVTKGGSFYTNNLGTPGSVRRSARLREAAESGSSHQSDFSPAAVTPGSATRRSVRVKSVGDSFSMEPLPAPGWTTRSPMKQGV